MSSPDRLRSASVTSARLRQLYPTTAESPVEGLYLCQDLRQTVAAGDVHVYSNFITSLDGRIAVARADGAQMAIPESTANPRDWRLLLELAAPADALIVSGRYVRQLAEGSAQALPPLLGDVAPDILAFREALGLPAQPVLVVVSNSLDVPVEVLSHDGPRPVIVATSDAAGGPSRQLDGEHVDLIRVGGERVEGARLVAALAKRDLKLIYSIAGPAVLHMLLAARVLRRLYLTTVLRVIGGEDYATMTRGEWLTPSYDFRLAALYLDPAGGPGGVEQLLQVFEHSGAER